MGGWHFPFEPVVIIWHLQHMVGSVWRRIPAIYGEWYHRQSVLLHMVNGWMVPPVVSERNGGEYRHDRHRGQLTGIIRKVTYPGLTGPLILIVLA